MNTVFTPFANAQLTFDVSIGTFTEDPSTLNMIPDTRTESILCLLRQPKLQGKEFEEPGNDERSFILKGHAVTPKFLPAGLQVGNIAKFRLFDPASDRIEEGSFEILNLQQSPYGIVSQVKGHAITGLFKLGNSGGIGRG